MKKKTIILILLIVITVGFLSGCNEQNDLDNEKTYAELIIGTWKTDFGATKIYETNGVFYLEFTSSDTSTGTYTLEDNKLTEIYDQTGNTYVYLIEFYDNDTFYEENIESPPDIPLGHTLLNREK